MGAGACCEASNRQNLDVDLTVVKKQTLENRAKPANYKYSSSLSRGYKLARKFSSNLFLHENLQELEIEMAGSKPQVEFKGYLQGEKLVMASGPELYRVNWDIGNPSNEKQLGTDPDRPLNYIVVVEMQQQNPLPTEDRDDPEDTRAAKECRSMDPSIEEMSVYGDKNYMSYLAAEALEKVEHPSSVTTLVPSGIKPDKIFTSKCNLEELPSAWTIEHGLTGTTKSILVVSCCNDLSNLERLSTTKFVSAFIHLDGFDDSMVKKFINATSVLNSHSTEVVIRL